MGRRYGQPTTFVPLEEDALNVALLVPEFKRATRAGLVGALTEHYGSPGRLADNRQQFERMTRQEGDDLTGRGRPAFGDMGSNVRRGVLCDAIGRETTNDPGRGVNRPWISIGLQPQDPVGGVRLTGPRSDRCVLPVDMDGRASGSEGQDCFPLPQGLAQRPDDKQPTGQFGWPPVEAVKVSAVLVDTTLDLVDIPAPAGEAGADGDVDERLPFVWEAVWADLDFCDSMVGATSVVAEGASSAIAQVASSAIAEVASSAVVEVASSTDAEVASSAVAEVAPSVVAGVA